MTLKPFKEMLALTKEGVDKALAPIRARQVKSQAELKTLEIEEKKITLETKVQEMCTDKTIDFDGLLNRLDEIALLERRQKQYKKVVKELFPDS